MRIVPQLLPQLFCPSLDTRTDLFKKGQLQELGLVLPLQ